MYSVLPLLNYFLLRFDVTLAFLLLLDFESFDVCLECFTPSLILYSSTSEITSYLLSEIVGGEKLFYYLESLRAFGSCD